MSSPWQSPQSGPQPVPPYAADPYAADPYGSPAEFHGAPAPQNAGPGNAARPYGAQPYAAQPYGAQPTNPYAAQPYGAQPGYGAQPYGAQTYGYYAARKPGTNGYAVTSLILGLLGGSVLGVIFGHVALNQIKTTGQEGRGLAIAGLVLSYGWLTLLIFLFILPAIFSSPGYY